MNGLFDMDELNTIKGNKATVKKENKKTEPKKIIYKTAKYEDLVHMNKTFKVENYDDFSSDVYPHSINFYDFEVFMCDWMVVIINPVNNIKKIIVNDKQALKDYYNNHKNEIWCGYNSRNYDVYILKSILLDLNPKIVNDMIIVHGMKGWQINEDFRDIPFYDFDIATNIIGLKQLEAYMGNNIRETSVPFDLDRALTRKEVNLTIKYCMHDVEQTIEVFRRRIFEYEAQMDLINTFDLPLSMVSLTKAQLTANILGCKKHERNDEFNLKFVKTLRLNKYKYVYDWFKNPDNLNYKSFLNVDVCGVPHTFGWGGLHGCPVKPLHLKGRIYHVDVTSYYPSIMIVYDFLTRNCKDKSKYKEIYDKRVELKRQGKKKEQAPYKIILNSTYGICKDKYSSAYDPQMANNVCINGQLMLLDLLEHLEGHADIIQSNTDGIILQVADNDEAVQTMKDICQEWMDRTGMGLGFDEIDEIYQGDVNSYIFKFTSGKLERKGAYVKELSELDNDLPIVNEAIVSFLTDGIEPKKYIKHCKELKKFQKVVKVSSNYLFGWHDGICLSDKTYRVFASINKNDSYIGKCKYEGATIEKFANTPDHCFIMNEDINGVKVPDNLDKQWYIDLAEKRIKEKFGINLNNNGLFMEV